MSFGSAVRQIGSGWVEEPAPDRAQQYGGAMPSTSATAEGPVPLGVPATYAPTPNYKPNYFEGDEWKPASLPPQQVAQLQDQLILGGYLDPKGIQKGAWDSKTRAAYKSLLEDSNGSGATWDGTLRQRISVGQQYPTATEGEAPRAPLVARVSNPQDLRSTFRSVAKRTMGRGKIDDAMVDRMVAAYQGLEQGSQQQAYNAGESGGTITAPPDAETFAEGQLQAADPVRYESRKVVEKFDVIANVLRGGS